MSESIAEFARDAASGQTLYVAAMNGAGEWLDFDDWTFKAIGDVTTIGLAMTAHDIASGRQRYLASIDLTDLAPGLAAVSCTVGCYVQTGGSPDPESDTLSGQVIPLIAQLGKVGYRRFVPQLKLGVTSTAGTELALMAWLEADGEKVPLETLDDTATCAVEIIRQGNYPQISLDATAMGSVNADHCFEPLAANPDFTADRIYRAQTTITANGLTFTGPVKAFSVVP